MKNLLHKDGQQCLSAYIKYLSRCPKGFVFFDQGESSMNESCSQQTGCTVVVSDKQAALQALFGPYRQCQQCPLATQGRAQVVFGVGNPYSKLMFVGEGPGRDEDKQGKPFVGRAGQLLDKIIEAMGFTRDDVYISNVVKCRPPSNRTPLPNESDSCKNLLLFKEIEIIQPKIICTLGATAAQALLGNDTRISNVRGQFKIFKDILVMPTYHPAYLLRNPAEKRTVWEDMKRVMEKFKEIEC